MPGQQVFQRNVFQNNVFQIGVIQSILITDTTVMTKPINCVMIGNQPLEEGVTPLRQKISRLVWKK